MLPRLFVSSVRLEEQFAAFEQLVGFARCCHVFPLCFIQIHHHDFGDRKLTTATFLQRHHQKHSIFLIVVAKEEVSSSIILSNSSGRQHYHCSIKLNRILRACVHRRSESSPSEFPRGILYQHGHFLFWTSKTTFTHTTNHEQSTKSTPSDSLAILLLDRRVLYFSCY